MLDFAIGFLLGAPAGIYVVYTYGMHLQAKAVIRDAEKGE